MKPCYMFTRRMQGPGLCQPQISGRSRARGVYGSATFQSRQQSVGANDTRSKSITTAATQNASPWGIGIGPPPPAPTSKTAKLASLRPSLATLLADQIKQERAPNADDRAQKILAGMQTAQEAQEVQHEEELRERGERMQRRRRYRELLKPIRDDKSGKELRRRFWNTTSVKRADDGSWNVMLDSRALRHPVTKAPISIPASKEHLAAALAVEWDLLTSAHDSTRAHLIPLTSLVCRALDIANDDASSSSGGIGKIRGEIVQTVLRYFDTDTLLCWAEKPSDDSVHGAAMRNDQGLSLHDIQARTADEIVGFLTRWLWPGLNIRPALQDGAIMATPQEAHVRDTVRDWVQNLDPWLLAGIERATLAGKGLLVAVRLVAEWGEGFEWIASERVKTEGWPAVESSLFGAEKAKTAANLEVEWQTDNWGEVQDTHDVEAEDLKRQFGSVVLLVSGNRR